MARFLRTDTNSSGGHSRLFNNLVLPAKPPPPLARPVITSLAGVRDRATRVARIRPQYLTPAQQFYSRTNLLQNDPGFTTSVGSGWGADTNATLVRITSDSAPPSPGACGRWTNSIDSAGIFTEVVRLGVGATTTFTVWLKNNGGANTAVTLLAREISGFSAVFSTNITITSQWTRYSITFQADEAQTGHIFYVVGTSGTNFDVLVDALQVESGSVATSFIDSPFSNPGVPTTVSNTAVPVAGFNKALGPRLPLQHLPTVYEPIAGSLAAPRDRVPHGRAFLRPPAVVAQPATPLAEPIRVNLAPSPTQDRRATYDLAGPVVINASTGATGGTATQFARTPRSPVHSRLGAPAVAAAVVVYSGPTVTLAPSRSGEAKPRLLPVPAAFQPFRPEIIHLAYAPTRARAKSLLHPPAVVAAVGVFGGPQVNLAPSSTQGRRPSYSLSVPFVIFAPPRAKGWVATQLVRTPRIPVHSRLSPPAVTVVVAAAYYGPTVTLAPSRAGKPKSRLLPVPSAFQPFRPEIVHLTYAPTRARAKSHLSAPSVVGPILARHTLVTLAPQKRGVPKSILREPTVVGPVLARAIDVTLVRIRPVRTSWVLRRPADLVDRDDLGYIRTHLVRIRPVETKSFLRAPAVVAPGVAFYGPQVNLVPSPRQGRLATYSLSVPFVIFGPDDVLGGVGIQLVRTPRIPVHSRLSPPAVVTSVAVLYYGPNVVFAYSLRGRPKSRLAPPAVVAPVLARPIDTTLVRIRPVRTTYVLRRPRDLVDRDDLGYIRTHLSYSLRGRPKSILRKPTVVAPVLARQIDVTLARIRPVATRTCLEPPVVVFTAVELSGPEITLAYSLRGRPKSFLHPPTDLVDQQDLGTVKITLAPSHGGKTMDRLSPPTVVFPFFARPTDVTLTRIRPPKTIVRLSPPTDTTGLEDQGRVNVTLAYSLRGIPKSILRKPVVIDLRPQTYYVTVTLAPSRFPTPKSILREPPKGTPQPAPLYPLFITLAPQRRGKAKPFLRQVVYGAKVYAPITVSLAPSRFPRPKSILRKPAVVAPVLARREIISLAPQRRGVAKPFLPVVIYGARVYAPISITLAPSTRLPLAPHSKLSPPTVVATFIATPIQVTLAPSRRSKPGFIVTHEPVKRPPFVATPISVNLAQITPPKRFYRLAPPAVVGAGIYFRGIQVSLAYSLRGRPISILSLTEIAVVECYGTVVGFDFSAEVCGDTTGATVVGSTSTGSTVSGGDSAATVEGTSEAPGTVCGEDTQREGCD